MLKKAFIFASLITLPCLLHPKLIPVNRTEAIVYGPEGSDIIDTFDISRPGIDGQMRTLQDRILERKMFQFGKERGLLDKDAVTRQLKAVQRDNNLSEDGLKKIFQAGGFTYDEGVAQFEVMTVVNQVTGMKVSSKLIIPEKDIVSYYTNNPIMLESEYYLQRSELSETISSTVSELKKKLSRNEVKLEWAEPFWIMQSELASNKHFIFKMKRGQLHIEKQGGIYEIFRLVDKKDERPMPLEERRAEIVQLLQPVKYKELFEELKKELDEKMAVVRL